MDLASALANAAMDESAGEGRVGYPVAGVVTNDSDGDRLGRVKARWGGMPDGTESNWIRPLWTGYTSGFAKVGDPILVLFAYGDTSNGFYLWFAEKSTKGQPSEAMMLGTMFVGMYNDLVAKFNELRMTFNSNVGLYNAHTHGAGLYFDSVPAPVTGTSGPPIINALLGPSVDAGKGKSADGSIVAANARSEIVLSARAKVK